MITPLRFYPFSAVFRLMQDMPDTPKSLEDGAFWKVLDQLVIDLWGIAMVGGG